MLSPLNSELRKPGWVVWRVLGLRGLRPGLASAKDGVGDWQEGQRVEAGRWEGALKLPRALQVTLHFSFKHLTGCLLPLGGD